MSISNINYAAAREAVSNIDATTRQIRETNDTFIQFYGARQEALANDAMDQSYANIKKAEGQIAGLLGQLGVAMKHLSTYIDDTEARERQTQAALGG